MAGSAGTSRGARWLGRILIASSLLAVSLALVPAALATAGALDTSFGGDGKVVTGMTPSSDWASSIAIQADRKMVVADGYSSRFGIARYNSDGTLNTAFSGDGKMRTDFTPRTDWLNALALQADGKVVAADVARALGINPKFALARCNSDGTLDATFSGDGRVQTDFVSGAMDQASGIAIQPDGKIVAAASPAHEHLPAGPGASHVASIPWTG